jgi:hypothetical protein
MPAVVLPLIALPPIALPYSGMPLARTYAWPVRPQLVARSAHAWWLAVACWFLGSSVGQFMHSPAALAFSYRYPAIESTYPRIDEWSLPGPLAVVGFGAVAVFLASLVFPMRDGAQWARVVLTVLAVPAELLLLRQIGQSLFTGPATNGGVVQGVLAIVALCAIPGAVSMMYRPATREYFQPHTRTR